MRMVNIDCDSVVGPFNPVVIYAFADTHCGNPGFDEELLKKHIDACKKEDAYWIHLGDWVDGLTPKDGRYDVRHSINPIMDHYDKITDMFMPIRERGIAVLTGNHDEHLAKDYGDYVARVARDLDVPYLGYHGFINLRLYSTPKTLDKKRYPQKQVVMYIHHGRGGGRTVGGKLKNLVELSKSFEADIYGMGHVHAYTTHIDSVIGLRGNHRNKKRFSVKKRYYFSCPAYFETYKESDTSNYAERAAFQPQATGCVRMEISLNKTGNNWGFDVKMRPLLG